MQLAHGMIERFARHPVAANLLMVLMLLAGLYALNKLNTQFLPSFDLDFVSVRVVWTGASAEDVQTGITIPLERELRSVDNLRSMTSTSAIGVSAITLEFQSGSDMGLALDQVKDIVSQQRNLPESAEAPVVTRIIRYEDIARLLVTGPTDLRELRPLIHEIEQDLLERGIARIDINGLPREELAIQVPMARQLELGMTLDQIADQVARSSLDLPAGTAGRDDGARQLRSLEQRRSELGFAELRLNREGALGRTTLGDIATLERRPRSQQAQLKLDGRPAVELVLQRAEGTDALAASRVLHDWFNETQGSLPEGVELHLYDQTWELIAERIQLLLKNGAGGLLLVLLILFLFLSGRLAGRVALAIPVAFTTALAVLWATGGSINMISLFGLIMALGIIVDNSIVVSEHAYTLHQRGISTLESAERAARRMLAPVISSSLTTVAAFLPLMLVGGIFGQILFDIPLVVVCVILATLVITFLILPAQLRKTLHNMDDHQPSRFRQRFDTAFDRLREHHFRPAVTWAVDHRGATLGGALALLLIAFGLLAGGRIGFTFFPAPDGTIIYANASFVAGTPPERVEAFVDHLYTALRETEAEFAEATVATAVPRYGSAISSQPGGARIGDQFGSVLVELVSPDRRRVSNNAFIRAWESRVERAPGLESFTIGARMMGPPGQDLDIRLTGNDPARLKQAALELTEAVNDFPGTYAVEDDMPFGREQLVYRLRPEGEVLGLSVDSLGRQLRAAFDGRLAQIYQDGLDEIEVRVVLPEAERHRIATLDRFAVILPDGSHVPLASVAELVPRQGFETLRHAEGRLAIHVSGEVDRSQNNAGQILATLGQSTLPELARQHGIQYSYEGRAADQAETMADMRLGLLLALVMIYVILAWVFGSYGWPLVVMAIIPFGLLGALVGHWVLGINLTVLSLFGLFGLTGIVVNNSIILVSFYQSLREEGLAMREAIIEAACQRLRAVLLTSMTTIAGLTPLLFETSVQAQFLIPMAVSIVFGLAFATALVLVVIPALLALHEGVAERWRPVQAE